jgi:hypothetical protein
MARITAGNSDRRYGCLTLSLHGGKSHFRLLIVLQSDALDQIQLGFQPVDVFFLAF